MTLLLDISSLGKVASPPFQGQLFLGSLSV